MPEDWIAPAPNVPAMQRRRFSALSRLVLTCLQSMPQSSQADFSVFASRHSEITNTFKLLENMVEQQPISPLGFSQSVHNTSAGLFTLVEKIQQASTTLSAGADSFAAGLVEAACYLNANPTQRVLLVCFDTNLVKPYQVFIDATPLEYCLALVLKHGESDQTNQATLNLSLAPPAQGAAAQLGATYSDSEHPLQAYPQACHFLDWWLNEQSCLTLPCTGQLLHVKR